MWVTSLICTLGASLVVTLWKSSGALTHLNDEHMILFEYLIWPAPGHELTGQCIASRHLSNTCQYDVSLYDWSVYSPLVVLKGRLSCVDAAQALTT